MIKAQYEKCLDMFPAAEGRGEHITTHMWGHMHILPHAADGDLRDKRKSNWSNLDCEDVQRHGVVEVDEKRLPLWILARSNTTNK